MLLQILGAFLRTKCVYNIIIIIAHKIGVNPNIIRNIKFLSYEFWILGGHEIGVGNIFKSQLLSILTYILRMLIQLSVM